MFLFLFTRLPVHGAFSHIAQQVKYSVNRNALSMFKALNKGFKIKCTVLLLNHIEG